MTGVSEISGPKYVPGAQGGGKTERLLMGFQV